MGYICTRCGGTNVACEAIVNPNTLEIIDYLSDIFMHATCSDCEEMVTITNPDQIKRDIELKHSRFVEKNGKEPEYAWCISFDNGASNSMFWETFEKLDLDAGDATWLHQSCCCNHCVNHWGIDLCECGSCARVGECECGSQKAHDTLGIKYDSFGAILKNFG